MTDAGFARRAEAPGGDAPRPARSVSGKELQLECTAVESAVVAEKKATREQLAPYGPGGAKNPEKGARGWHRYLIVLHRTHASGHVAGVRDVVSPDAAIAAQDLAVLDALRAEPIVIRPAQDDRPVLAVYPKSLHAYLHLHALERQLDYLLRQQAALEAMRTPDALELLPRVAEEIAYTYQLVVWAVTTPGPGLPYDPVFGRPVPPAEIQQLAPWDYLPIAKAHHQLAGRLAAVRALIDASRAGETAESGEPGMRPSWSLFIASASDALHEDPVVLMRDRALVALLAAVQVASAAKVPRKRLDGDDA